MSVEIEDLRDTGRKIVIVVGSAKHMVAFPCSDVGRVTHTMVNAIGASEGDSKRVIEWSLEAKIGEWLDWPMGYAFCVDGEPAVATAETKGS